MTYALVQTQNADAVAEHQYATADEVQFTYFDTCIGLAGIMQAGGVFGAHLVMNGGTFSAGDAGEVAAVIQTLQYQPGSLMLIGQTGTWQRDCAAGFDALVDALAVANIHPFTEGMFRVYVDDGRLLADQVDAAEGSEEAAEADVAATDDQPLPSQVQTQATDQTIAADTAQTQAQNAVQSAESSDGL